MDIQQLIYACVALAFVLALMGILTIIAKKLGLSQNGTFTKHKRLKIIEALPLDSKHRAVILQCDAKQHLVILSQNGDTIIDHFDAIAEKNEKDVEPF